MDIKQNILQLEGSYGIMAISNYAGDKKDLADKSFVRPIQKQFAMAFEEKVYKDFGIGQKIVNYLESIKSSIEKNDIKEAVITIDRLTAFYKNIKLDKGEKPAAICIRLINDQKDKK